MEAWLAQPAYLYRKVRALTCEGLDALADKVHPTVGWRRTVWHGAEAQSLGSIGRTGWPRGGGHGDSVSMFVIGVCFAFVVILAAK